MIKVAIDTGPLSGGHAVRGIGKMVGGQIEAMKRLRHKDIKLETFDFQSEDGKKKLENGKYDIVHYPYFFPYSLTLPTQKQGKKTVVTIQDLIHLIYPKHYPSGIRGKLNLLKQKMRLRNFDAVLTISETSKKDIVRFLGISAQKIHVVYLAPRKIFKQITNHQSLKTVQKKFGLPSTFVLYVGDVNYNKNIPNLIKACNTAKIPLVIVGKHALEVEELGLNLKHLKGPRDWFRFIFNIPHPELAHFKGLVDEFKGNPNIIRTGFTTEEELFEIFNLASVYVQPSFYEGFGLPVLEAMASGIPVVIAKTNALVEIANSAALVADPKDPKDMAKKINEAMRNKKIREQLIKKGFENVKKFSWEKTAEEMIEIYKGLG